MSRSIEGRGPRDARAVFTALGDLAGIVAEAKRIQVDALNQLGFSVAEYQWVPISTRSSSGSRWRGWDSKTERTRNEHGTNTEHHGM
jgi:hypothetical protein